MKLPAIGHLMRGMRRMISAENRAAQPGRLWPIHARRLSSIAFLRHTQT